jgi:ribosomal protein S18 acetylase RimI-like enzyme
MNFRRALSSDAATIAAFQVAMASETENLALDFATVTRGVAAVFERAGLGCYFVAEEDGKVLGSLLITYEWSDWRDGVVWWIQSVYVAPEQRGKGVFTKLYEFIKQQALADKSVMGLRLYVEKNNTRAQKAYEKLGMDGAHYAMYQWMKTY